MIRSLEFCTSELKRASPARRWISSLSAALSSASDTCVASDRSAPRTARDGDGSTTSSAHVSPWAASSRTSPPGTSSPGALEDDLGGSSSSACADSRAAA